MPSPPADITLSIVSHGQSALVADLLDDVLAHADVRLEIVLTINIAEDERPLQPYIDALPVRVVRNAAPKGFGANHNAAFTLSTARHFAVVNPDIRARPLILGPLVETLGLPRVGTCGPLVLSVDGRIEDSARRFPTVPRLAGRLFARLASRRPGPDYAWKATAVDVDWIAGMFMLFRREAYEAVGGFDERYFMYLEDTDICRRLWQAGWSVKLDPRASVVHDARRASRRSLTHLQWHLTSALRFLMRS